MRSIVTTCVISALFLSCQQEAIIEPGVEKGMPSEWLFQQRAFPDDQINEKAVFEVAEAVRLHRKMSTHRGDVQWKFEGPINVGGRITDIEIDPQNSQVIYAAAATGGIFKTTDNGDSWQAIFDEGASLSIGDLALAPSDPSIVYAGTGEHNGGGGSSLSFGRGGIYRSEDGGDNWRLMQLTGIHQTGKILVHPDDPNTVYVGAMGSLYQPDDQRGVFKSTDGGVSWEQMLIHSDSTGCIDMCMDMDNPDTIYAAMWERIRTPYQRHYAGKGSRLYRSFDGGQTWEDINEGIPVGNLSRLSIQISSTDASRLYCMVTNDQYSYGGMYRSDDHGDSWELVDQNSLNMVTYGWWFNRMFVDPNDGDHLYALTFDASESTDGGETWTRISNGMHVDHHAMAIDPNNSQNIWEGNDGGVYHTTDNFDQVEHIEKLPVTQFYSTEIHPENKLTFYGGTQDNGTHRTEGAVDGWNYMYGGDGMYVRVSHHDVSKVFVSYQMGVIIRTTDNERITPGGEGNRWEWRTPYILSKQTAGRMYVGAQWVFQSDDWGDNYEKISEDLTATERGTISSLDESILESGKLIAGTSDGNVWIRDNEEWTKVSESLPTYWATCVKASPKDPNTFYAGFSGYKFGSTVSHLFKTTDNGQTWESISGDMPGVGVNDIEIYPDDENIIVAATDFGVFETRDGGTSWAVLGDLPNVPMIDLAYRHNHGVLSVGTFGRGMFSFDLKSHLVSTPKVEKLKGVSFVEDANGMWLHFEDLYGEYIIQVWDMQGRELQKEVSQGNAQHRLNLRQYVSGTLIVQVRDRQGRSIASKF